MSNPTLFQDSPPVDEQEIPELSDVLEQLARIRVDLERDKSSALSRINGLKSSQLGALLMIQKASSIHERLDDSEWTLEGVWTARNVKNIISDALDESEGEDTLFREFLQARVQRLPSPSANYHRSRPQDCSSRNLPAMLRIPTEMIQELYTQLAKVSEDSSSDFESLRCVSRDWYNASLRLKHFEDALIGLGCYDIYKDKYSRNPSALSYFLTRENILAGAFSKPLRNFFEEKNVQLIGPEIGFNIDAPANVFLSRSQKSLCFYTEKRLALMTLRTQSPTAHITTFSLQNASIAALDIDDSTPYMTIAVLDSIGNIHMGYPDKVKPSSLRWSSFAHHNCLKCWRDLDFPLSIGVYERRMYLGYADRLKVLDFDILANGAFRAPTISQCKTDLDSGVGLSISFLKTTGGGDPLVLVSPKHHELLTALQSKEVIMRSNFNDWRKSHYYNVTALNSSNFMLYTTRYKQLVLGSLAVPRSGQLFRLLTHFILEPPDGITAAARLVAVSESSQFGPRILAIYNNDLILYSIPADTFNKIITFAPQDDEAGVIFGTHSCCRPMPPRHEAMYVTPSLKKVVHGVLLASNIPGVKAVKIEAGLRVLKVLAFLETGAVRVFELKEFFSPDLLA